MRYNKGKANKSEPISIILGILSSILVGIALTLVLTKIMMSGGASEKFVKLLVMVAHGIAAWIGSVVACVATDKSKNPKKVFVIDAVYILLVSILGILLGGTSFSKLILVVVVTLFGCCITLLVPIKRTKRVRIR